MTTARFVSLLLAVGPAALASQQALDARWLPWLGCWRVSETSNADAPLTCVRFGADPRGVEMATVVGGESVGARDLIADGQPHDFTLEDCQGSQVARFSADGRRIYLRATLACPDERHWMVSGIMAMASPTVWLDVGAIAEDQEAVPQVRRFSPAAADWPDAYRLSPELASRVTDARALAAATITLGDVQEMATEADSHAVTTFLIERGQPFALSVAELVALDDAAVPRGVIDALVAVSYPTRFAIEREAPAPAAPPVAPPAATEPYRYPHYPFGWGWWGYGRCALSMSCDASFYGTTRRGYGTPVDFSTRYVGRAVVVDRTVPRRGLAVSGRGYTRTGESGTKGNYAQPRPGSTISGKAGFSSSGNRGTGRAVSSGYTRVGGSTSSRGSSGTATAGGRR